MIEIDGSVGEGGGQILRTSLALSMITGAPVRIARIRAGRSKPGLLRQHLTGVKAAIAISGATARGDVLGSTELTFVPGPVRPGEYAFAVGTAGSANLVLQTVLPPLLLAGGPSWIAIEGGTHNPASPPYHFLDRVFLPLLSRMGAKVELELEAWGFYPAGGGRILAAITPAERLSPIHLVERGPVEAIRVVAVVAGLPAQIARREVGVACKALGLGREAGEATVLSEARGPGNAMWIEVACAHAAALFTGFGERGVTAEAVSARVVDEAQAWLAADVPVDGHLADQLLIPLALAGGGSYRTVEPTPHTLTNVEVIRRFLDVPIRLEPDAGGVRVHVG